MDLISNPLLFDWKIDSIHLSSKLVKSMQNINDGRMNKIKFYFVT
jgi:hypothetical protein